MAKKAYVGVSDVARNCSKIYVGVNNVARKVVKGYVGVNGIAQQFWGDSSDVDFYLFRNGELVNVAPNATLNDIADGNRTQDLSTALVAKKAIWTVTNGNAWPQYSVVNKEIITPDLSSYSSYSSMYCDNLSFPIKKSVISPVGNTNPICIRVNCKATKSGVYRCCFYQVTYDSAHNVYQFGSKVQLSIKFGTGTGDYPLNVYQDVFFYFGITSSQTIRNYSYYEYDDYYYFSLEATPNNGDSAVLSIKEMEVVEGSPNPVPEYNYVAGQTYSIRADSSIEDTLDAVFRQLEARVHQYSSSASNYGHLTYLVNNWVSIRNAILNNIKNIGINFSWVWIDFQLPTTTSSSAEVRYTFLLGEDVFPKNVKIDSITTDTYGMNCYVLDSASYLYPTYKMTGYNNRSEFTIYTPLPLSQSQIVNTMGLWATSGYYFKSTASSFGMIYE